MKADVSQVMQDVIDQIRVSFPFDVSAAQVCDGECRGCSLKLLAYLETEIDDWDQRLHMGVRPGLADLSGLIRSSRKIARVLARAGLMKDPAPNHQLSNRPSGVDHQPSAVRDRVR